ncbi:unnamed protein product [Lampetra planeri]
MSPLHPTAITTTTIITITNLLLNLAVALPTPTNGKQQQQPQQQQPQQQRQQQEENGTCLPTLCRCEGVCAEALAAPSTPYLASLFTCFRSCPSLHLDATAAPGPQDDSGLLLHASSCYVAAVDPAALADLRVLVVSDCRFASSAVLLSLLSARAARLEVLVVAGEGSGAFGGELRAGVLSGFPNLATLGLPRCGVEAVGDGALEELPRIRRLDLSGNNVSSFSTAWFGGGGCGTSVVTAATSSSRSSGDGSESSNVTIGTTTTISSSIDNINTTIGPITTNTIDATNTTTTKTTSTSATNNITTTMTATYNINTTNPTTTTINITTVSITTTTPTTTPITSTNATNITTTTLSTTASTPPSTTTTATTTAATLTVDLRGNPLSCACLFRGMRRQDARQPRPRVLWDSARCAPSPDPFSAESALPDCEAPSFLAAYQEVVAGSRGDARLTCAARGVPAPRLSWLDPLGAPFGNTATATAAAVSCVRRGPWTFSTVTLAAVSASSAGLYACRASSAEGAAASLVRLTVARTEDEGAAVALAAGGAVLAALAVGFAFAKLRVGRRRVAEAMAVRRGCCFQYWKRFGSPATQPRRFHRFVDTPSIIARSRNASTASDSTSTATAAAARCRAGSGHAGRRAGEEAAVAAAAPTAVAHPTEPNEFQLGFENPAYVDVNEPSPGPSAGDAADGGPGDAHPEQGADSTEV